ncbi:MAG: M20/M25/M40 family metallo-hydrolase, partial [Phenylobacterium sp.]
MHAKSLLFAAAFCAAALASPVLAAPQKPDPALHAQALELLTRGIAFRTVIPGDQVQPYAEYLKGELVKAGFKPDEVKIEPVAGSATLTARYAGTDPKKKPIIIIDHMDVVEAKASDWTRDPFKPVVENGYVY